MAPLSGSTLFFLQLIVTAMFMGLAMQVRRPWNVAFGALSIAIPVVFIAVIAPPSGQYAWLGYVLHFVLSLGAIGVGLVAGLLVRHYAQRSAAAVAIVVAMAALASTIELRRQFVPEACLTTPLQVAVVDSHLAIPIEMAPHIEIEGQWFRFRFPENRYDARRLCRQSRNGTEVIDATSVRFYPASSHHAMSAACSAHPSPDWCMHYDADPYRLISDVIFGREAELDWTTRSWSDQVFPGIDQQGTRIEGSVCRTPGLEGRTTCTSWGPFSLGRSSMWVRTNNLAPEFEGLPVQRVRDMMQETVTMIRAITSN